MTTDTYTLYDIPTKNGPHCWSPNTWIARGILNAKRLPFTTEWVEYPDIAPTLSGFGIEPLDDDPRYELPMLRVVQKNDSLETKTTYLRDSADIVKYIDDRYPVPPVDVDGPINNALKEVRNKLGDAIMGIVATAVPDYLAPRSSEFFHKTRNGYWGCSVAEYRKKRIEGGAWEKMEAWAHEVQGLLKQNGGPFFLGEGSEKLSLVDIKFFGILKWADVTGHDEDFQRIMKLGAPEFDLFYAAAKPLIDDKQTS